MRNPAKTQLKRLACIVVACVFASSFSACVGKTTPEWAEPDDGLEFPEAAAPEDDLVSLIQKASVECYLEWFRNVKQLFPDNGKDIPVVITSDGEDTWALAWCYREGLMGQYHALVWKIEGTEDDPKPVLMFECTPAISPGLSADVYEYDNKFLLCGELSEYHWDPRDNSRIDLSARSYLIVKTLGGETRVPADSVIYVCILDSVPVDILIYDGKDSILLRLSDWDYLKGYLPNFRELL